MSEASFRVTVRDFSVLLEIPGSRSAADFVALLNAMEFDDTSGVSEAELRELCLMSLQDLEPERAAEVVLKHDFSGRLSAGQIHNIATEMLDEKLWEEYADMSLHEHMFNAGSLLHAALPRRFPRPDAVRVSLGIEAMTPEGASRLAEPLHESFLVRLLADGMTEDSALHRLFEDKLAGARFSEAENIVWIVQTTPIAQGQLDVDVTSSGYWLDALRDTRSYESTAQGDDAGA